MSDCIEFKGFRNKQGYGVKRFRGANWMAHRMAWTLSYGEIPKGVHVLHKCDNPPCMNPEHLFLGTQDDNMKDAMAKGRISHESRNQGRNHGRAKITEQTAIRMKMLHGVIPARVVGEWLGISGPWAGAIMRGDQWRHVTAETRYGV